MARRARRGRPSRATPRTTSGASRTGRCSRCRAGPCAPPGQILVLADVTQTASRSAPSPYHAAKVDGFVAADVRTAGAEGPRAPRRRDRVAVMINGPSGTGKEVLARFIHAQSGGRAGPSSRSTAPPSPTACSRPPCSLREGAFTGAQRATTGKFRAAQGGTLLLDEISELDLGCRRSCSACCRSGARAGRRARDHRARRRVLATSNRNLRERSRPPVREDLFYRLNVFPLTLPPLRERPRDILPLARALLSAVYRPAPPCRS